jgi:hypothetical protein
MQLVEFHIGIKAEELLFPSEPYTPAKWTVSIPTFHEKFAVTSSFRSSKTGRKVLNLFLA